MKKNILFIIAVFVCSSMFAQGEIEALRLSRNDLQGTARGQAMAGAFGALGGDVTGVGINPAGLGVYRSSEINATLNFSSQNMESNFGNLTDSERKNKFNFSNISYVGYYPTGNESGLSTINFAFSYNRLKDFNRKYTSSASGMNHSLSNYIAEMTNANNNPSPAQLGGTDAYYNYNWLSVLGWDGYLMNENDDGDKYVSVLRNNETTSPRLNVIEKGQIETFDFSLGTNFSDNFYIGGTFSLTEIDYRMFSYYQETLGKTTDIFYLDNYYKTNGSGYQFKLGAIWRPVDCLRLGVAYHSPTWYSMSDYYYGDTEFYYQNDIGADIISKAGTPSDSYDYRFRTPYGWTFSAAGILGTQAILSLDWEIKDYRSMNYRDRYGDETGADIEQNNIIDEDYRMASTLRLGAEYRFTPQVAGRFGFAYAQNPYEETYRDGLRETVINGTIPHYMIEGDITSVTAGIGYRFSPQVYLDFAFVYRTQTDRLYYFPSIWDENGSSLVSSVPAEVKNKACTGLVTLGYKF